MKAIIFPLLLLVSQLQLKAQTAENLIIITTDGFRWQEVFKGLDKEIANNPKYNQNDSLYLFKTYGGKSPHESRKKIMPFLWSKIAEKGQIYGNRDLDSKVDNFNPLKFSYPGYSEIFCGFVDPAINSNDFMINPNMNVLEYLNTRPWFKDKIAVHGAWGAFPYILAEERSKISVTAAFETFGGKFPNQKEKMINAMMANSIKPWHEEECLDVFTHAAAIENMKTRHPRIVYIAYGETDEWAHAGLYRYYLDAAHHIDNWLKELWTFIESDKFYKGKTTILLTVDHGRGDQNKDQWTSHGAKIDDCGQIWFAVMGPGIPSKGEMKNTKQLYQKQFAQTIAMLLYEKFVCNHEVAEAIDLK
ncbi:MAG TPA: hypothetical protein VK590_15125 [Saprospiraceae bacterium]|nr:hypothetical protein [Saprospiraceae bacterium]